MQYKKIIAILSLTMLCTGSIVGCNNKTANTNTEVNKHIQASDEYKDENKITLKSNDKKIYVYMPMGDLTDADKTSILATNYDKDNVEISDTVSVYDDLPSKTYKRINVTFDNGSSLSYEFFDDVKDPAMIIDIATSIQLTMDDVTFQYTKKEVPNDQLLYTVMVDVSDTEKVLINITTKDELSDEQIQDYVQRISLK